MIQSDSQTISNSANIEELQDVFSELLQCVGEICKTHDLHYYLAYGTLLGAVREHSFIPWDDDVDVWMPIDDYLKLESLWAKYQNGTFILQCNESDSRYQLDVLRIRKRGTFCPTRTSMNCGWKEQGVWLDIYPLYPARKENVRNHIRINGSRACNSLAYHRLYGKKTVFPHNSSRFKLAAHYVAMGLSRILSLKTWMRLRRFMRTFAAPSISDAEFYICYSGDSFSDSIYKKEWFDGLDFKPLGKEKYPVPSGWDQLLTCIYGDYMTPVQRPSALLEASMNSLVVNSSNKESK